ncbi:ester cyclase [Streptomyces sp. NPDC094448]|uniref:ester cyclase n=1 Tax=Streptomyces sp. NPDC094448 TaxID=3366063 RepID=UPI00382C2BC7
MTAEENMQLMQSLDDAWNAQDWDTFDSRHAPDTIVHWPGQPAPTRGRHDHRAEAVAFFATFPDNHVANRPYRVLIGGGDWTCSVARFTGTMTGPMKGPGGEIPPTGRAFAVDFCTVAHWVDGMIVEENLFYDLVGLMQQIGLND